MATLASSGGDLRAAAILHGRAAPVAFLIVNTLWSLSIILSFGFRRARCGAGAIFKTIGDYETCCAGRSRRADGVEASMQVTGNFAMTAPGGVDLSGYNRVLCRAAPSGDARFC